MANALRHIFLPVLLKRTWLVDVHIGGVDGLRLAVYVLDRVRGHGYVYRVLFGTSRIHGRSSYVWLCGVLLFQHYRGDVERLGFLRSLARDRMERMDLELPAYKRTVGPGGHGRIRTRVGLLQRIMAADGRGHAGGFSAGAAGGLGGRRGLGAAGNRKNAAKFLPGRLGVETFLRGDNAHDRGLGVACKNAARRAGALAGAFVRGAAFGDDYLDLRPVNRQTRRMHFGGNYKTFRRRR